MIDAQEQALERLFLAFIAALSVMDRPVLQASVQFSSAMRFFMVLFAAMFDEGLTIFVPAGKNFDMLEMHVPTSLLDAILQNIYLISGEWDHVHRLFGTGRTEFF